MEMRSDSLPATIISRTGSTLLGLGLLSAFVLISQTNFLLFHTLLELVSISIMWAIAILVWHNRARITNQAILFLGIAFFYIGIVDILHALSYKGMGVLPANSPNIPTQLWIARSYLQGLCMLTAPLLLNRRCNPLLVMLGLGAGTALLISSIFTGIFPHCFLEGSGLTPFKKGSEFLICLILAAAMLLFYRQRQHFAADVLQAILLSMVFSILARLSFTLYISVYGISNIVGHGLNAIAFLFLYKAMIETGIEKPFRLLFREVQAGGQALRESEERFTLAMEASRDGIWDWRIASGKVYFSPACMSMLGYENSHFPTDIDSWSQLIHPDDKAAVAAANTDCVANRRQSFEIEFRLQTRNGTWRWILSRAKVVNRDDNGTALRMVGTHTDITERRQAEEVARRNETLQRKMIANIGDVLVIIDRDGINRYKSPNLEKIFGWKPEELVGQAIWDTVHPQDISHIRDFLQKLMREPQAEGTTECRHRCKDGRYKWIEFIGINLLDDPDIQGILGNYHDITERKKAEQFLSESEARFKALHNASFGGISIHDKGMIMECNQGLAEMTGYSTTELIGMNGLLLIAEESRGEVMEKILAGYEKPYEAIGLRKNGEKFPMRLEARNVPYKGKAVRTVEFRDITEHRRDEEEKKNLAGQLQQAQKMEAIGILAGGIAHDFNNILGAVLGYAEMIREDCPRGSVTFQNISQVLKAGNRAKELVKQILAFSRQAEADKKLVQPATIIQEAVKMLRPSLPSTIAIEQDIDPDAGTLLADPTHIHQIVMNLCTNAFHAMEKDGGTLTISLHKVTISPAETGYDSPLPPGDFIELSIRDTGHGIAPEIRQRIFDPYFTTKEVGKGTGMGLAMVHGLVQSYHGSITCDSQVGQGTVFHVVLPTESVQDRSIEDSREVIAGGTEHILFIDDEPMLAEMAGTMLRRLGYTVTVKNSSLEALTSFQNQPEIYDLVITDQTMPGLTGVDLARRLLHIRPDLPIILCTGFSTQVSEEQTRALGIREFALKPLAKRDIAKLVRKVLDAPAGSGAAKKRLSTATSH